MARKKLFLIDGSAIFYRSYFAFIRNPMINSKGENTSATFGFLNTMFRIIEDELPDYLAIVFDTKEPTFRHKMYAEYKATREKMPEEMAATFPPMIEVLKALNFCILDKDGFEADDIIGTLCKNYAGDEIDAYIVSGDKDLAQLVNEHCFIYSPGRAGTVPPDIMGSPEIFEKYGVKPEAIVDWLALMGDASDNVPGVPSVGKKTAAVLLNEYETIDNIYSNVEKITKNKLRENLINNKEQAYLSQKLVTLDCAVDMNISLADLELSTWEQNKVAPLLKNMEFNRLTNQSEKINQLIAGGKSEVNEDISSRESDHQLINSEADFEKFLEKWKGVDEFCFDLETNSLDTFVATIAGIAVSFNAGQAVYIVVNHPDSSLDQERVLAAVKPIFENPASKKIGHNIKYDAMIMHNHGIRVENIWFDTMIASYLVNPTGGHHNLDAVAERYLGYKMITIHEVIGSGKDEKLMTDLPAAEVFRYACEDADITFQLKDLLQPELKKLELDELFYSVEMPLVPVLMDMEETGVKLDEPLLADLSDRLTKDIDAVKKEIFEKAGEEFNVNSTQQLGPILFDKLAIHIELGMRKPPKTKTGKYSTSEQVLERYRRHPLPKTILNYRKLNKLKNTYVDALPELIKPSTGKIHTSYNQTVAATGRLSSTNPNLQNIPIRTELGREMRLAFIPSNENDLIMSADYSQIELRIMAHLSGDEKMRESFRQELDIHAATAAQIFDVPLEEVTADNRRKAKEINFGIIYGMSKYGLANRLEITVPEAESFMMGYFATYPRISEFSREIIQQAMECGFVTTMMKRRRYLPEIQSTNRQMREFAERTAINTPIQGTAADLIKLAMIKVFHAMAEKGVNSKMLLQVHDELVFEVPKNEVDLMTKLVRENMEGAVKLEVPVKVDVGVGANWLEAH